MVEETLTEYEIYKAKINLAKQNVMNVVKPMYDFETCMVNENDLIVIQARLTLALEYIDEALKSIRTNNF